MKQMDLPGRARKKWGKKLCNYGPLQDPLVLFIGLAGVAGWGSDERFATSLRELVGGEGKSAGHAGLFGSRYGRRVSAVVAVSRCGACDLNEARVLAAVNPTRTTGSP
ncbi:MAG: hypothetical protein H6698_08110 [Myxococcales bacterium]|nr:hypothetical protein [Myxococcales bacterium]